MRDISIDGIREDLNLKFDNHSLIQLDNHYYAVFQNLEIKSNSSTSHYKSYLPGNTMPIFFSNKYFHMLLDNVCLAEYSKPLIENLNIQIFVVQCPLHKALGTGEVDSDPETFISYLKNKRFNHNEFVYDESNNFEYFEDIYNMYSSKSIFYSQTMNVKMEKCFTFIGDDLDLLELYKADPELYLQYYFGDGSRDYSKGYTHRRWVLEGITLLKDKLNSQYKVENKGRKIYISRLKASQLVKDNLDTDNLHRVFENELVIEDRFRSNGFDIVSFEGMSFIDQYEIINQASEVAGYNGTNLLNTVLSQKPIKVIEVTSLNSSGSFDYNKLSNIFKNTHIFLSENDIMDVNNLKIWR